MNTHMVRKSYGGLRGLLEGNLLMHLQGPGRGRRTPADGDAARKAAHFGGLVHSCIEADFSFLQVKTQLAFLFRSTRIAQVCSSTQSTSSHNVAITQNEITQLDEIRPTLLVFHWRTSNLNQTWGISIQIEMFAKIRDVRIRYSINFLLHCHPIYLVHFGQPITNGKVLKYSFVWKAYPNTLSISLHRG